MPLEPQVPAATEPERAEAPQKYHWYQKISAFLLIIFCLEIGCFLLVFPWMGDAWDNNFFSSLLRHGYLDTPFFSVPVTALPFLQLSISFSNTLPLPPSPFPP